jgi:anti-sigma factor ChrR (cupin superfamily)
MPPNASNSIHDEGFWDQVPAEFLRTLVEQGRDNGLPTSIFALGDPHRLETPGIVCIKAGDGHHFPRHCHDCERFEVVLDGGFTDGTGQHYIAGDVMIAHHMDMYGPHIADPGGYVVLEYFGSVLGTYELFWDTKRGPFKANKIEEEHGTSIGLPVSGERPPASPAVERGASFQSIHDPAFWNQVPAPYLQPLVDSCLPCEGMAYRLFALGDPNDPETPAVTIFRAPPGYVLPRHSHDCHRFEVVLEGSLTDEHGDVLTAGSIATAIPGQMYGPSVAGPEGWISAEFFSRLAGTYEITWDTKHGPLFDNRLDSTLGR